MNGTAVADPAVEAILEEWRRVGRPLIAAHRREFAELVRSIQPLIDAGQWAEAASEAQAAAWYAVLCHPGAFASSSLERALWQIGAQALGREALRHHAVRGGSLRILHVATEVGATGGHVRNMWRWINEDAGNRHSVALTRQHGPTPEPLHTAVARTGGSLHRLNRRVGKLLTWAGALRGLCAEADVVVLHTYNHDVIPFMALAGLQRPPRVILVNHADHLFWLGAGFADMVVNTRQSGRALSAARRGIPAWRNALLPLCVEPIERRLPRPEAKRGVGLPPDAVVLLTIARRIKFRPFAGIAFPDPLVPLLREDSRLHLVAVGAGKTVDWSAAQAAAPGRVLPVPETPQTGLYLDAADIYLDSFPFVSITSLFEAGLHGLPLVTRDAYGTEAAVIAADSPGLDGSLLRTTSAEEMRDVIRRLAGDTQLREETGARTRAAIREVNMGPFWRRSLEALYEELFALPPLDPPIAREDTPEVLTDIDLFTPFIYGDLARRGSREERLTVAESLALKTAPLGWRTRRAASMIRDRRLGFMPMPLWRQFVPEWAGCRLRSLLTQRA